MQKPHVVRSLALFLVLTAGCAAGNAALTIRQLESEQRLVKTAADVNAATKGASQQQAIFLFSRLIAENLLLAQSKTAIQAGQDDKAAALLESAQELNAQTAGAVKTVQEAKNESGSGQAGGGGAPDGGGTGENPSPAGP